MHSSLAPRGTAGLICRAVLGAVLLLSAFAFAGAGQALAAAAPGALTYQSCISEPGGDLCGSHMAGLSSPWGLALSPDGTNVYLPGADGNLTVLDRGAAGTLAFNSCQQTLTSSASECPVSDAIFAPRAVAVSGDGKNVYVADTGELLTFARAASGALTYLGCIGDNAEQGTCAMRVPGDSLTAGSGPGAILVSPDGKFVYVATAAGGGNNGAVSAFSRAADGTLTPLGCIAAEGGTSTQGCSSEAPGVTGAGSFALSSSGFLFVGGYTGVASFKVAADGTLSTVACIGSQTGCTGDPVLLGSGSSAQAISLSSDGAELYVASSLSHAFSELSVSGGTLASVACMTSGTVSGCSQSLPSVSCPVATVTSADGADVYVTDSCAEMLTTYSRSSTGALTYDGCIAENGSVPTCQAHTGGLDSPVGLALSTDDSQLIVAGHGGSSVATFARVLTPPTITITSPSNGASYTAGTTVDASYSCASVTGGAIAKSCVGSVANGLPADTTVGSHTFTVTVTDLAGTQTTQSVTYTVVPATPTAPTPPAPALSVRGFKQSHTRWSEARSHRKHRPAYGTIFSFTLSASSPATLTFTKAVKHHGAKVVGSLHVAGASGSNRVSFLGLLGRSKLKPGRYSVRITATAGSAQTSAGPLHFTILG